MLKTNSIRLVILIQYWLVTDGRTHYDNMYRAIIASRDKKTTDSIEACQGKDPREILMRSFTTEAPNNWWIRTTFSRTGPLQSKKIKNRIER